MQQTSHNNRLRPTLIVAGQMSMKVILTTKVQSIQANPASISEGCLILPLDSSVNGSGENVQQEHQQHLDPQLSLI